MIFEPVVRCPEALRHYSSIQVPALSLRGLRDLKIVARSRSDLNAVLAQVSVQVKHVLG